MTIRTRLAVLAFLPLLFALLVGVLLWLTGARLDQARSHATLANDVIDGNNELAILTQQYLLYREARPIAQWHIRYESLGKLIAKAPDTPEGREQWQALQSDYRQMAQLFDQLIQQPSRAPVSDWRQRVASQLLIRSMGMNSRARQLVGKYEEELDRTQRNADILLFVMFVLLSIASATISLVLTGGIKKSFARLTEGVQRVGAGDLQHVLQVRGKDELAQLAAAINDMSRRLRDSYASLASAEQRYRNLFDNMADGYALHEIVLDERGVPVDYRFLEINPAFERMLGLTRADVIGKTVLEVIPDLEAQWIETYGQVALTGQPTRVEQYAGHFNRRFDVSVTSPERGLFATVFHDVTERRMAEESLKESEEQLASWFNSSPAGMFVVDREFRFLRINQTLAALNGPTVEAHLGKTISEILPNVWPKVAPLYARVLAGETLVNVEVSGETPRQPGTIFYWNASYFPLRRSNGDIAALGGVVIDITARKRAEEALNQANAYNRSLIEASLDPLITIDPDGRITDVNAATEQVTGLPRSQLIGTDFSAYFTYPDKARWGYEQAFREGFVRDYALEIHHRDGHTTPVLYNATVYRDAEGRPIGVFAAARDITARKQAEDALARASMYNRSLIEASVDPLVTIAPDGKITDVNAATEAATGLPRTELIGTDFSNYFTDPDRARAGYEQAFRRGFVRDLELNIRHRDGHQTPVLYNATVFRDPEANIAGVFAAARDVTERKQTEMELARYREHLEELVRLRTDALQRQAAQIESANIRLRELDRLKSMFIASMSHELRTPLNTIIGFTGIILQGMVGDITAEQRKQLSMVKESAGHLLSLVNDVIDISKIEAGTVESAISAFDLIDLIKEVVVSVSVSAQTKGLKLSVSSPEKFMIESDRRRVRQIFINLIGNAIKFTDEGGITITVRPGDEIVAIDVRDTGIGIAETDMKKLFTAFTQIITEGRPKEGSGLGLYLSYKIADLLGGNISARSKPGEGSVFTVTLPTRIKGASEQARSI